MRTAFFFRNCKTANNMLHLFDKKKFRLVKHGWSTTKDGQQAHFTIIVDYFPSRHKARKHLAKNVDLQQTWNELYKDINNGLTTDVINKDTVIMSNKDNSVFIEWDIEKNPSKN